MSQERTVIESKPDHFPSDFRLNNPCRELTTYAENINLDTSDPVARKHILCIFIRVKMAEEWTKGHGGRLPSTRDEKKEFKQKQWEWMKTIIKKLLSPHLKPFHLKESKQCLDRFMRQQKHGCLGSVDMMIFTFFWLWIHTQVINLTSYLIKAYWSPFCNKTIMLLL
ncbi:Molybdenum cofactor biosynthesis, MoeB [Artemisia annua]|uniref:Molybdenum cofactor biosynthesis, MoeB n=1 Tax=Artemisia annua TaxID=35608 RepID=A0A2U1MMJ9_ARTAN|nr:Molybdenum cofactor biosynthesis, MoeB [Artemisia annua]